MLYNAKDVAFFYDGVGIGNVGMGSLYLESCAGEIELGFMCELLNWCTLTKTLKCRYKKGCRKGKVRFVEVTVKSKSHDDYVDSVGYLRGLCNYV